MKAYVEFYVCVVGNNVFLTEQWRVSGLRDIQSKKSTLIIKVY
jgi:hypothetical protein